MDIELFSQRNDDPFFECVDQSPDKDMDIDELDQNNPGPKLEIKLKTKSPLKLLKLSRRVKRSGVQVWVGFEC